MSLLKNVIKGLAEKGEIEHVVTLHESKFILRPLSTEEQILSETLASTDAMKEKYEARDLINTYADTVAKLRNLTVLSFAIKSIDEQEPVDVTLSPPKQLEQRIEFIDDLSSLNPVMIDRLLVGYNKLQEKVREFYKDPKVNLGK